MVGRSPKAKRTMPAPDPSVETCQGRSRRRRVHGGGRRRVVAPCDRHVGPEPLGHPVDERVVARPDRRGVGGQDHLTGIGRAEGRLLGRRMETDPELRTARWQLAASTRPDDLRVLDAEPRLDVGEQPIGGRHSRDEASLRGLTRDLDGERQSTTSIRAWHERTTTIPSAAASADTTLVPLEASDSPRQMRWSASRTTRLRSSGQPCRTVGPR